MEELTEYRSNDASLKEAKSNQRSVDLEYFGKYLTNEYGVLERTLSCLNINDLISASFVTDSWKQVCECLLKKRKDLRWHIHCKSSIIPNHDYKKRINFKSMLALGFQMSNSRYEILNELIENDSYLCYSSVIDESNKGSNIPGVQDDNMVTLKCCNLEIPFYTKKKELKFLDNAETILLFPDLKGFNIYVESYFFDEECGQSQTFSYPLIKGILVLSSVDELNSFEESFNDLLNRSTTSVAVAGGIFDAVKKYSREKRFKREDDLVKIFFCGENVTCYSNVLIHKDRNHVENFMKRMEGEVGPYNSKEQRRIAIISRCRARPNTKYEKTIFKKYFPEIPTFTLLANGECGLQSFTSAADEHPVKRKKHDNVSITFYSVVYFFITLNLSN